MRVGEIMMTKVISVQADTTITKVAELLFEHDLTGVPVVNQEDKVIGMITEHDLVTSASRIHLPTYLNLLDRLKVEESAGEDVNETIEKIQAITAEDIMTEPVTSVTEQAQVEDVARIFFSEHVNPIPVVGEQKKLVGIVSQADIVKLFVKD